MAPVKPEKQPVRKRKVARKKKPIGQVEEFDVPDDLKGLILNRFEFYRDGCRWGISTTVVNVIITLLLVAIIAMLLNREDTVETFPLYSDATIIPEIPLDQPPRQPDAVGFFAEQVSKACNQWNHVLFREQVGGLRPLFTASGYNSYVTELNDNHKREFLEQNKMVTKVTPTSAPIVTQTGVSGDTGVRYWVVTHSIDVFLDGKIGITTLSKNIELIIVRVPRTISENQLAVARYTEKD